MNEVIHLGSESIETYFVAEYLLKRGYTVTVVGHGPSMGDIIPDGTRMILKPLKNKVIATGEPIFCCVGTWGYQVHLVTEAKLNHDGFMIYRMETSDGDWCGNVTREKVYGKYAGAWKGDI